MGKSKRNQTFQYLEALAILMVIDDHMSTRIGILSSVFPYNSFYMPMFVFISGYFYKKTPILQNIKHKIRHLMIPYIIWALVGNAISYVLMRLDIVYWYREITPASIWCLISSDTLSSINGASWFVIMLIWVSVGYNMIQQLIRVEKNRIVDYGLLAVTVIAGFISLKLCMSGYNQNIFLLPILRSVFYIQFYHMGTMFRKYWESFVNKSNALYVCCACVLINVYLICNYGDAINFYSTAAMGLFQSWWLPLITSITGTIFWYKVMYFVSNKIGPVRIIDFIAENTFVIMEVHLFFLNIPNFYVYFSILHGSTLYPDFDVAFFQGTAWLRYSPNTRLIGYFCGLFGSLLVALIIQKVKAKIHRRQISA